MRPLRFFLLFLVAFATVAGAAGTPTAAPGISAPFLIVLHPANPATSLDRRFLSDAFLKRTTRWPGDELVRPVDLASDSPVRRAFTDAVLKRSVSAVKSYWQQQIFSGRDVPPPELDSDEQVLRYVSTHAGAIGYVSGTARVDGVRVAQLK